MGQSCLFVALVASFTPCGTRATNKNMPSKSHVVILLSIHAISIKKWMEFFEWLIDWCFYFPRVYYAYHWSEKGDGFETHTTMLLGTTASVDDFNAVCRVCRNAVCRISLGRQTPLKSSNPRPQNFVLTGQK